MTTRRPAALVPFAAGAALLGAGWMLLPGRGEIVTAAMRAHPVSRTVPPAPASPTKPAAQVPELADLVAHADAATLARETAAPTGVTTAQVAWDLRAAGRPAVAVDYLAMRPDGASAALWPLRFALLRAAGRQAEAVALVEAAVRRPGDVPATQVTVAAYTLDRADLVAAGIVSGALPRPDAAQALDLARRLEKRPDLIAALDRAGVPEWRARDPWLALRVARASGDTAAALRAVALLPVAQRDVAREELLAKAGDREALRAMWRAQAARGGDRAAIAERLLATGWREDALAVLRDAAASGGVDTPAAQRLLYLMGPRPGGDDLAWLKQRAGGHDAGWLTAYAERDRPAAALAFLAGHPLADTIPVLVTRMRLARAGGDEAAGRTALAALLDGRRLEPATLRDIAAVVPRGLPPQLAETLATRRIAAGVASPAERMDLAWGAWNRGDTAAAERWLREQLRADAEDAAALRLMAQVQAKRGGAKAARPWWERALAATPAPTRERAELLDRLGRHEEALRIAAALRADAPRDRALAAMQARLLIAAGRPGAAQAVLAR